MVTLQISHLHKPNNEFAVNYGVTDALAPFPLHSLVNVISATIHNNTVTTNVQETLPLILRLIDPEEFAQYDSMTPKSVDYLAYYEDAVEEKPFQLDEAPPAEGLGEREGSWPYIYKPGPSDVEPTGATEFVRRHVGYISHPNNILSNDQSRPAGTAYFHRPRGSWQLKEIWAPDAGGRRLPTTSDNEVYVKFEVCEPLLLSPFVFGSGHGKQGFYGIQAMRIQMVMTGGNANRAWRSAR